MAQTIAVQRGSTTNSSDGNTKTTIFTQSSGTATRVIVVGSSIEYATSSGNSTVAFWININGSGSYVPVIMRRHGIYSSKYMAIFPSDSASGVTFSGVSGQTQNPMPAGYSPASGNGGGWVTQLNNFVGSTYEYARNSQTAMNICPSSFWMANGDSLVVSSYNDSAGTATINYHFVTVTES